MEYEVGPDELLSTAVVRAVSAIEDREPLDLPPIANVLDPDALDTLFTSYGRGEPKRSGRVSFVHSESLITIENGRFLTIEPFETTGRLSAQSAGPDRAERSRSNRDTQQTATKRTPGSPICFVCQQPIERENPQRERGELVHHKCRTELRCGISL